MDLQPLTILSVPVIIALVQAIKLAAQDTIPDRFYPMVALAVAGGAALAVSLLDENTLNIAYDALITGLAASGLYDVGKSVDSVARPPESS